jgi:hypothetical protein
MIEAYQTDILYPMMRVYEHLRWIVMFSIAAHIGLNTVLRTPHRYM